MKSSGESVAASFCSVASMSIYSLHVMKRRYNENQWQSHKIFCQNERDPFRVLRVHLSSVIYSDYCNRTCVIGFSP
jgi:hypothetical protein